MKNPGCIVITKLGKKGRTFNSKDLVNGKMPVYLETAPLKYSDKAILCSPETLKVTGYID